MSLSFIKINHNQLNYIEFLHSFTTHPDAFKEIAYETLSKEN